ncbi:MAG: hypothetical protein IPI19_10480 [Ignavibacteriales bacterium]|nr:hypothetical protein [Ignavibacteriales bacterium]
MKILRTTNGGVTWRYNQAELNYFCVSHFTDSYQVGVGDQGTILRTTNGGTNWSLQSSGTRLISGVQLNSNIGWAGGVGGTILKQLTEETWASIKRTKIVLSSVHFLIQITVVVGEWNNLKNNKWRNKLVLQESGTID